MHPLPNEMDEAVFKDLSGVAFQHLVTFFRSKGCTLDLSMDLAQETLLYAWEKIHKKKWESVFTGALLIKALNLWRDHCRKRARHGETELNDAFGFHIARDSANDTEYWDWLNTLDVPEERIIIHLRYAEGCTRKEISEILKIHPSSVLRQRISGSTRSVREPRASAEGLRTVCG